MKFDPTKPFNVVEPKQAKFNPKEEFNVVEEPSNEGSGVMSDILGGLDIAGAGVRTAISAAADPNKEVIPEIQKYVQNVKQQGPSAALQQPSGEDINAMAGVSGEGVLGTAAGIATEVATDPLTYVNPIGGIAKGVSKWVGKPLKVALKNATEKQTAKALSKYVTNKMIKDGADIEKMSATLVNENLQGGLKDPSKLYQKLTGQQPLKNIGEGVTFTPVRPPKMGGLIAESSQSLDNVISQVSNRASKKVNIPNIQMGLTLDKTYNTLFKQAGESSSKLEPYLKELQDILKPGLGKPEITLIEAQKLKKEIGKLIPDAKFHAGKDVNSIPRMDALLDLNRTLDGHIENGLKGIPIDIAGNAVDAGEYYKAMNSKLSNYYKVEEALRKTPTKELQKENFLVNLLQSPQVPGGGVIGAVSSGNVEGAMIGAGVGAMASGAASLAKDLPATMATDVLPNISKSLDPASIKNIPGFTLPTLQKALTPNNQDQQVMPRINMQNPRNRMLYDESLIRTPFPRTTEEVMKNPGFVVAKLRLTAGEDVANAAQETIKNQPHLVPKLIAGMQAMFPQLLADDKYNRIDHKIMDPALKSMAIEDTMKDERLSNTEKISRINVLNKTGEFHG